MALRVLLADESSTIKKVFQLALQDYGVEVRPVNIGVDVAMVAKGFKPDIIFADVMLQKKNGYDVCAELKQDAALRAIPFVLMWSGFVELDEDKFQASHANAQLEKPFDVAALRKLVSELVPRTQSQSLSQFLTFPKATAEAEKRPEIIETPKPAEAEEDFQQMPIPKMKGGGQTEKYRLNLKPEELDPASIPVEFDQPAATTESFVTEESEEFSMREAKKPAAPPPAQKSGSAFAGEVDLEDDDEVSEFTPRSVPPPPPPAQPKAAPAQAAAAAPPPVPASAPASASSAVAAPMVPALSAEQLEKIIRQQSAEVIESVVWKVIPELATQIIERELNKLLKERDSHP